MDTQAKMGRPSTYSPELVANLLNMMSEGNSLRTVCKMEGMPSTTTIMRWLSDREDFREQYARACEDRREVRKEQLLDIPLDQDIDPQRGKLLSENIKWVLGKEAPKKYGDRQQIEHSGAVETGSFDPSTVIDQLVVIANTHPTMVPQIREWAQKLMAALPVLEG